MKSNTQEKINVPLYFISLDLNKGKNVTEEEEQEENSENGHHLDQLQFTCSQEQLQDLVTKLKDAVKQVERTANSL
jgi:hypothetical protein